MPDPVAEVRPLPPSPHLADPRRWAVLSIVRAEGDGGNLLLLGDQHGERAVACQCPWADATALLEAFPEPVTLSPGRVLNYYETRPDQFRAVVTGDFASLTEVPYQVRSLVLEQVGWTLGREAVAFPRASGWAPLLGWAVYEPPRYAPAAAGAGETEATP